MGGMGFDEAAAAVIQAGRAAAARGWVPATSGNFSVRLDGGRMLVTRSGRDKGRLVPADLAEVAIDGPAPAGTSAETPLHQALYRDDPAIGAIFHVHSPASMLISHLRAGDGVLALAGWELQKAFAGITTHDVTVTVPVFPNDQDTVALAGRVSAHLATPRPGGQVAAPGYLLAGHGIYAWGATPADAERHLDAFDALFSLSLELRRIAG
ncbi:methylthioribulose 1-phosphate dehydratase [Tistrella mobilis]|uniref:Methylthioribulose-1-phosphate dehydratase n=1 Tax=Tistrella mobilis (strain KA081020-065) TaxID=1110502 RepID=I3TS12_TISMK|nr:methylthioribulose 1-phosphate dehydratase [Tistrella mobilis]AFK55550.1 methylthioribulose-1-phosphate dehydratase [Tistrella mobilis KA081020-065]